MGTSKIDVWNMALHKIGVTQAIQSEDDRSAEAAVCRTNYDTLLREVIEARQWPWATRQRMLTKINSQSTTIDYADQSDHDTFLIPYAFLDNSQVAVTHIGATGTETVLDADDEDYTVTPADAADATPATIALATALIASESVKITVTTTRVGWDYLYSLPSDLVTPVALLHEDTRFWLLPHASRIPFEILPNDAGDGFMLACDYDDDQFDTFEYVALLTTVPLFSAHFIDCLSWRLAVPLALGIRKDANQGTWALAQYERALSKATAYANNTGETGAEAATPGLVARA